jgi:ribosome-associated toxin RatA of RatAB toxin-antitoxin module
LLDEILLEELMVQVEQSIQVDAPAAKIFDVVANFASYPEIQPEMEEAVVIKETKTTAEVAFTMKLIAEVNYTLKFTLSKPGSIKWTMVSADSILQKNDGKWTFKKVSAKKTDVKYEMDVEFGGWIPSSIIADLMKSHLPQMLERFKEAAEA